MPEGFASIEDAIAAIGRGEIVIVSDDPDRENEGDFVMAAEFATPDAVNFMITYGRGLLCTPVLGDRLDALGLRPIPGNGPTAFALTVDLAGDGTGISAHKRAACIRRLVDERSTADEFVTPGHVFPLRARGGGVLERAGHTEAAVDLAWLAGLTPAGMICEIMNDDGSMARVPDLHEIARRHGLLFVTIADLIAYRRRTERRITRTAEARIPTEHGTFRAICFDEDGGGHGGRATRSGAAPHPRLEHVALVLGTLTATAPVHVHTECILGDVFGSLRCACGGTLADAMRSVAEAGEGVIVYVRSRDLLRDDIPDDGTADAILDDLGVTSPRMLWAQEAFA